MAENKQINVEIAYARADQQCVLALEISADSTIKQAILASNMLELFPEIDLTQLAVGVFGQRKLLTDKVMPGDRIEIYRPLTLDPMISRRLRAKSDK